MSKKLQISTQNFDMNERKYILKRVKHGRWDYSAVDYQKIIDLNEVTFTILWVSISHNTLYMYSTLLKNVN